MSTMTAFMLANMSATLVVAAQVAVAGADSPDAWLRKFVSLAEQPAGSTPSLDETERLFSLQPSGDAECPRLLELTPDHPAFVEHAWASMTGPEPCSGLRLSLVNVSLATGPRCATRMIDYFASAFGRGPQVEHPEPNTDYRWQIAPGRAFVVTQYGGSGAGCSVSFADAIRPPPAVKG